MLSKKLFPSGEVAAEGSVSLSGSRLTSRIVLALSCIEALVSFVILLFILRELVSMRDQQMSFMRDIRDQQMAFQTGLREELQAYLRDQENEAKSKAALSNSLDVDPTEDWRRDHSATFLKNAEVHHRANRALMANRPSGPSGKCSCPTPAAPTTPPQVTTTTAPPPVTIKATTTAPPPVTNKAATAAPPQVTAKASPTVPLQDKTTATPTAPPQVTTTATPTATPEDTYRVREADCAAYKAAGHTTSGVYTLGSPLSGVEVYCDMDTAAGGWTVIQRRMYGSVPFNRTWEDYKHGFGNKNGEYWLGNENIHLLTDKKNYVLRIDTMGWDGEERYAEYSTFRVSGESDQYRLHVSGYSGTEENAMDLNNGQMFSTVDRDNDASGGHCSHWYGQGGWWFWRCGDSFLNGRYLGNCGTSCGYLQGVAWGRRGDGRYSLQSVCMKIRP
ncbi:PREDICTED: ficolin-1-like [Branchiostoma belcheri]|uniref:Ficolin-1-like n=1 Tax=Branchiostoma belcheri TaxID=7741 RepID=A0A6P4YW84_BRABE|nr:PREDICTED: ficolin-1-like [Branchiostoma belcheri]